MHTRGERAGCQTCVQPFVTFSRRRSEDRDTPPELVFGLAAVRARGRAARGAAGRVPPFRRGLGPLGPAPTQRQSRRLRGRAPRAVIAFAKQAFGQPWWPCSEGRSRCGAGAQASAHPTGGGSCRTRDDARSGKSFSVDRLREARALRRSAFDAARPRSRRARRTAPDALKAARRRSPPTYRRLSFSIVAIAGVARAGGTTVRPPDYRNAADGSPAW